MAFTPKSGKMTWSRSTPNDGELFEAEFNKVYDNTDYLKAEVEANVVNIATNTADIAQNTTDILNNKTYDYVVKNQDDFTNAITRTAVGEYKINDNIKSLYIKYGTYSITSALTDGDTSMILSTNNCCTIDCENIILDFADKEGYLNINTTYSRIDNLTIKGNNPILTSTPTSFYCNAQYIILKNCISRERRGPVSGFLGYNNTNSFINCRAEMMGEAGFYNSYRLINCMSILNLNGFSGCIQLSNCIAQQNSYVGFLNCKHIESSCYSPKTGEPKGNNAIAFSSTIYDANENCTAGCLSDGTPIFKKILTGIIPNTSTYVDIEHNISNAMTNKRIIDICPHWRADTSLWIYEDGLITLGTQYNDTNIRFTKGGNAETLNVIISITYR